MELSTKLMDETAEMVVRDPETGEDTDVTITLAGLHSELCRKAQGAIILRRRRARQTFVSQQQAEADALELLATITTGWKNFQWDGQPYEFSKENALNLYKRLPWLRGQADAFLGDDQHFLSRPSSNS